MAPAPRRRKTDSGSLSSLDKIVLSGIKAGLAIICSGILAFVGSWGIETSKSIAGVKSNVEQLQERERMLTEMVWPDIKMQIKDLKNEIKELRKEIQESERKR